MMRKLAIAGTLGALLSAFLGKVDVNSAEQQPGRSSELTASFPLTAAKKPVCSVVTLARRGSSPLVDLAVEAIAGTVKRWSEVDLPLVEIGKNAKLPEDAGIVLATLDELKSAAPDVVSASREMGEVATTDEDGFAVVPIGNKVFVVSRSVRGVYNGAIYLRDFLLDGSADRLAVRAKPLLRTPAMKGRTAYVCNIWGTDAEYTADDWKTIFRSFARDGIDRIYFWTSGHFPSQKFPQTYRCKNAEWDTTAKTRIGTIPDLRAIIEHAHDYGMKIYLGGGLGGWCGTAFITNRKPGTMKTGAGEAPDSLCPSNAESRAALLEYYVEMFDALPKADGVYIELADEYGACHCPECSKPLDSLGSKGFGRAQLTLAREIADAIRSKHPHAKFAFTVGYDEHAHDPLFYQMVRDLGDDHYEWMEARGRWDFTGPTGTALPASQFSRRVMKWKQWYNKPLELLVQEANHAAQVGFYGLLTSFEPGFASGSFYTRIPFPTDLLPYVLTGFSFREMTWEPTLSREQLKQRVHDRFFGAEAPQSLADDFWSLREVIRTTPVAAPYRQGAGAQKKGKISEQNLRRLASITASIDAAWPQASPKTREGLELMRKAIADTRGHFEVSDK